MENKNQLRNIDPQKIRAENLNGKFALVGLIALVGAYITTGQIVPGIIWFFQRIFSLSHLVVIRVDFFVEEIYLVLVISSTWKVRIDLSIKNKTLLWLYIGIRFTLH